MGMFEQVLADMRERAAVARDAAKHNPDGTVHHEAVADMLEHLAARAEVEHKAEVDAECNLREEIERLREIVKELADELETMICNEIVKSSKRRVK